MHCTIKNFGGSGPCMYISSHVGFAFIHTHEDDDLVKDACVCQIHCKHFTQYACKHTQYLQMYTSEIKILGTYLFLNILHSNNMHEVHTCKRCKRNPQHEKASLVLHFWSSGHNLLTLAVLFFLLLFLLFR